MEATVDSSFYTDILDVLPDAVIWAQPVYNATENITDFEIRFSNKEADAAIEHPLGSLTGLRIIRDGIPSDDVAQENFRHFLKVYETGQTEEFVYYAKYSQQRVETLRKKFRDGVMGAVRDRWALREAEKQEHEANMFLKSVVDTSPNGILMYEAVRNEKGTITDFKIRLYNERSNMLTGYTAAERQKATFRQVLNNFEADDFFEKYVAVVETGQTLQHEQYIKKFDRWVMRSVAKLNDGFVAMLTDITEMKALQQALQHQSSVTDGILDASLSGIYSLVAVRNEQREIIDFSYVFVNNVIAKMLHVSPEQVIGASMLTLIPETKTNGFFHLFCNVLQTGETVRGETHFITKSTGFNNWFDYIIVRMEEDTVVVTLQDITEKKEAALRIEQQKGMLDNILKYSSSGILVSEMIRDADGKVVDARTIRVNDAAIKYTGISEEAYASKTARELDPSIFDSSYYSMVINTLETGKPFQAQYFLQPAGRWLETAVSKMNDDHVISIFTDITETRNAQIQLEKLVEDLKRSNANLEEFTYAASHDLKEPIRKINTFTSLLRKALETRLKENEVKLFDRVQYSADRMTELVDDLLEYSHVTANPQGIEKIDLNAKIVKVLEDLELVIQEKRGNVTVVGQLPVITGYRRQIQQVFHNLIGNALKYSKPEVAPEIKISCTEVTGDKLDLPLTLESKSHAYYKLDVTDNGIGFEQQYAEKIFQVFQRLHGRSEYKGTGVGLAIVKKVIQNHNGFITVRSEPNVGSTFTMYLPKGD